MTRDSLYAAASLGLSAEHIIEVLHRYVGNLSIFPLFPQTLGLNAQKIMWHLEEKSKFIDKFEIS